MFSPCFYAVLTFLSGFTIIFLRKHMGSVVECLTQDRGDVGLSLTGVTVLCP